MFLAPTPEIQQQNVYICIKRVRQNFAMKTSRPSLQQSICQNFPDKVVGQPLKGRWYTMAQFFAVECQIDEEFRREI